jgi:hypothetical protein
LNALEDFRKRDQAEPGPGVYLEESDRDFAEVLSLDDKPPEQFRSEGTLVVTEQGKLVADVDVNLAVIDGFFKGKIIASEHVVLENHALVIGEINTPTLTIRGGAIIEGRCYFEPSEQVERPLERWERTGWHAFKVGFAKVWRSRIFQ